MSWEFRGERDERGGGVKEGFKAEVAFRCLKGRAQGQSGWRRESQVDSGNWPLLFGQAMRLAGS